MERLVNLVRGRECCVGLSKLALCFIETIFKQTRTYDYAMEKSFKNPEHEWPRPSSNRMWWKLTLVIMAAFIGTKTENTVCIVLVLVHN